MPSDDEFRQTHILAIPIDEASAKVRTGPPIDDEDDLALEIWAGVLPLGLAVGTPEPDPSLGEGIDLPPSISDYRRPGA